MHKYLLILLILLPLAAAAVAPDQTPSFDPLTGSYGFPSEDFENRGSYLGVDTRDISPDRGLVDVPTEPVILTRFHSVPHLHRLVPAPEALGVPLSDLNEILGEDHALALPPVNAPGTPAVAPDEVHRVQLAVLTLQRFLHRSDVRCLLPDPRPELQQLFLVCHSSPPARRSP